MRLFFPPFTQFSPCLNTHLQAIIKWLESRGACVHGVEVRGLPWRPDHLEISIIPRSVLLKRSARRRAAHTPSTHVQRCPVSYCRVGERRNFARWDRSPDGRYWISQMCSNALKGHRSNECQRHYTAKQVYLCVRVCAQRLGAWKRHFLFPDPLME